MPELRGLLARLSLVNRQWHETAAADRYWKSLATALLPVLELRPTPPQGYRKVCM